MAKILYNVIDSDPTILNNLDINYLWKNINVKFKDLFIESNFGIFDINNSYNFRPDKVAYNVYRNDLYYPLILFSNKIDSILQFKIELIGTKIKYLLPEYVNDIIINLKRS